MAASSKKRLIGAAIGVIVLAFLGWGLYQSGKPVREPVQGQIEAWEEWPEGYATPNRRIMYASLNWCQEHHTEIIDALLNKAQAKAPSRQLVSIEFGDSIVLLIDKNLLDRMSTTDADAIASHDGQALFAMKVQERGPHGFTVFGAEHEDMSDFDAFGRL